MMADFGEAEDFPNPHDEPENSSSQFPDEERPPGEDDVDYSSKPEKDAGPEEMYDIEGEAPGEAIEGADEEQTEREDPNSGNPEGEGDDNEDKPDFEGEQDYGNNDFDDDEESDDDDVQITIDVNKPQPAPSGAYTGFNVKRGAPGSAPQGLGEKSKFNVEEFEGSMTINGVPSHEYSLESLEDKPWRKPGADITDYFNYGFNESTWLSYTERQRRMRMESGAGVPPSLGLGPPPKMPFNATVGAPIMMVQQATTLPIPISVVNENSKYAGSVMVKKAGPPPARKMAGAIDVIGGGNLSSRRPESGVSPSSPNVDETPEQAEPPAVEKPPVNIDFSRPPPGFPNLGLPPPYGVPNMPNIPPPVLPPHPQMMMQPPPMVGDPYGSEFLPGPPGAPGDEYFPQYNEPTQDSQWGSADWRGGPPMGIPPMGMNVPGRSRDRAPRDRESLGTPPVPPGEESRSSSSRRRRSRTPTREDRDKEGKDRDRDRESRDKRERDRRGDRGSGRDRDRSERDGRDRSERRSRRHGRSRSRSRTPSSSHKRSSKRSKRDRSKSKSSSE